MALRVGQERFIFLVFYYIIIIIILYTLRLFYRIFPLCDACATSESMLMRNNTLLHYIKIMS